jgi:hypothetical protein
MRRNWLTKVEHEYVRSLLDEAIEHVKLRIGRHVQSLFNMLSERAVCLQLF